MTLEYRTWTNPIPLKDARKLMRAAFRRMNRNRKTRKRNQRRTRMLRHEIYARDGGRCVYCHRELTLEAMTLDHVIPFSKGGPSTARNLVSSCRPCNEGKGDSVYQ